MALRLEIISSQNQQLGPNASIVLGVSGGSIGRALDNDWSLPDPQRYLSAHHARFHARPNGYFLEDISSNGVFVNGSTAPQGRRGLHALHDGDVLRMGEYRIRVHIEENDAEPSPGSSTLAEMAVENVVPLRAVGHVGDDLGASLNIEALIPAGMDSASEQGAVGRLELQGRATISAQQKLTRLRAAARARLEGNVAPPVNVHNGMQAFCRGAGIDPSRLPMENEAQSLRLAGRMLREAIIGLKEILRAQQAFRDHYRMDAGKPGNSPLDKATDEYLLELLSGHENHQFDAVMRLRECFTQAGKHDAAVDPALRSALEQFMAHLSPTRMESGTGSTSAETGWTRYKEIYGNLLQNTGDEVPHLFLEAIAQSYADARRKD
ncbi:MAG: type VI secretion system-associated FHA domain protein [Pseudomonadota bacterium]